MAKARKDTKTMEKAAASYAKFNRVDLEDEQAVPYEMIVVQPFTATDDPTVLGIKPIPNLQEKIDKMIKHYGAETIDIEDIEYEEADLEEEMWNPKTEEQPPGDVPAKRTLSPLPSCYATCNACREARAVSSYPRLSMV